MSNQIITISQLKANYQNYLQAQNPQINAFATNSFWDIDAGAMASIFLDLYMNLQVTQNAIYPQYAAGDQVDQWLYARGLPARGGITFGSIICYLNTPTITTPYTIPAGTIFTDIGNSTTIPPILATNNKYQTFSDITISNNTSNIPLYALTAGNTIFEAKNAILTNLDLDITIIVQSCAVGQLAETDQQCITRILNAILIPPGGSRQTDYFIFALNAYPAVVTDAIIIPAFFTVNKISVLGVFPLVGTPITDYQLDQGLATGAFIGYSRQAGSDVISQVNTYIQNQRLVGLTAQVGYCSTYIVPNFTANVSLSAGYSLSTIIIINTQTSSGTPTTESLTIQQIIKREIRRAICNQAYGATVINGVNYITIDSLITAVNNQLAVNTGQLAQILINLTFNITDILVPNYSLNQLSGFIEYTYDVASYNAITVNLI